MHRVRDARTRMTRMSAIAAVLILFQLLSAPFVPASSANLDAFGNPLCIGDRVETDGSGGPLHGGLPECCTLACPMVASPIAPPPAAPVVALRARVDAAIVPTQSSAALRAADGHEPGNPRAPPAAV